MIVAFALLGCGPRGPVLPGVEAKPCNTPALAAPPRLGVIYTDSTYAASALGLQTEPGVLDPPFLAMETGDAIVRSVGDRLYVVNRLNDAVSAFERSRPWCPIWETSLEEGSNVHDLVEAEGKLWLPSFGTGKLIVLDREQGEVLDSPVVGQSLDRAAVFNGRVWVADQKFSIASRQVGTVLEVDPVSGAVLSEQEVGPNPRIEAAPDGLFVATGYYQFPGNPTAEADLVDGALFHLNPVTQVQSEDWLTEGELEADLHTVVAVPGGMVAVGVDADARSFLTCVVEGVRTVGPETDGWYVAGASVGEGRAVFAVRSGLTAGDARTTPGVLELDVATCAEVSFTASLLEPFDLTAP